MPNSAQLTQQWQHCVRQLLTLGPMRSGSICSQVNRRTAADGSPAQSRPYPIVTCKAAGKTQTRRLRSPHEVEQARAQINNFRRFQELSSELIALGRQRADLDLEPGGKKNSRR